jgi:hypothetical protein
VSFFDDEPTIAELLLREEQRRHERVYWEIQSGGPMSYVIQLDKHPGSNGRWGTVYGTVKPYAKRVAILVFSHDERWYTQKPATNVNPETGRFSTAVAFGLDAISDQGREYIVVGYVGPDLPTEAVYEDLNSLPPGSLSAPISVSRTDGR